MCLVVGYYKTEEELQTVFNNPLVLKEDMLVYKILLESDNKLLAQYHHDFAYELNKIYLVNEITKENSHSFTLKIAKGFHSYLKEDTAFQICMVIKSFNPEFTIYKCKIPAKSRCFMSDNKGEIVSDIIIVLEKIY